MKGPGRLVLGLGIVVGLGFALFFPPLIGGADEATHLARAVEMAHGRLTPGDVDGRVASPIPQSYRDDQVAVAEVLLSGGPFDRDAFEPLWGSRPDWSDTYVVETQPTLAATPLAYAPSAVAMVIPDRLGWAGIWVLWAGRIGNLVVYLAVAWVAVRVATAFRWSLAIAAVFPMNIGIAASVTPDALTIASFLLVVAVWTRVWRPVGDPTDPTEPTDTTDPIDDGSDDPGVAHGPGDVAARSRADALAAIGGTGEDAATPARSSAIAVDEAVAPPAPDGDGRLARLGVWTRTPLGTGAMVLAAGLLLVGTKPPYFLVLAAFPALLVVRWADRCVRAGAVASLVALAAGTLLTTLSSAGSYKAVTTTLAGDISYQPDVQQDRLLSDPLGFLGRVGADWFGNFDARVQRWVRHVGYVEVRMPSWISWVVLVALVVAAVVLDRRDLLRLRRFARVIWLVAAPALTVALYASSYIYFDDTVEGERMGLQIARYVSPFFAIAVMGWAPRLALRLPARHPWAARVPTWIPVAAVVVLELVVIVAGVRTWNVVGWSLDTSG